MSREEQMLKEAARTSSERERALGDLADRRARFDEKPASALKPATVVRLWRERWSRIVHVVKELPLDAAVTALGYELSAFDGFPERGDSVGRGGGDSTLVESLVSALGPVHRDAEAVDRCLTAIEVEVARLSRLVARRSPLMDVGGKMLCEVSSYGEEWAMPVAGEPFPCPMEAEFYPSGNPRPEHLCAKHRKRKERWERAHHVA